MHFRWLCFVSIIFCGVLRGADLPVEKPVIILLNGASSAGKSSIAVKLQEKMHPALHVGFDHFCIMLPGSYMFGGAHADQGFSAVCRQDEKGPIIDVKTGPVGKELGFAMRRAMKALADSNFSLIIDELLLSPEELPDYKELFRDYKVYFISVKPPLDVVIQREKERGDRVLGMARGCYEVVYANKLVDLEIDSSKGTPEQLAQEILNFIRDNPHPHALKS